MIPLKHAMIAWTPETDRVVVGLHPDRTGWSDDYDFTDGACMVQWWPKASKKDRTARLFVIFNTMVVRDRVDVLAAHRALLAIQEYREMISPDQEGAA